MNQQSPHDPPEPAQLLKRVKDLEAQLERQHADSENLKRQTEMALQKSRSLLDATQKLSHAGGWEWDITTQTGTWTDETYRIHGYPPDEQPPGSPEYIHRSLSCYTPEDRQVVLDAFQRCAEQGQPYDLQFPFTAADGRRLRKPSAAFWQSENKFPERLLETDCGISISHPFPEGFPAKG